MRTMILSGVLAMAAAACALPGGARADVVPPIKGNDTGGIISYNIAAHTDIRGIARAHCAQYGKVPKYLGAQNYYGGYISFACRWVRYGVIERPLRVRY